MVAHVLALEPGFNVAAGLVGAALVGAAVQAGGLPGLGFHQGGAGFLLAWFFAGRQRWRHACGQPLGQLGVRFARQGQRWQAVGGVAQDGLDDAVHQQVGVAPDRAGEVRVGLERQAEVPVVAGRVDGLLHGAQQHHVDLLRIGPVLGCFGNRLELGRRRVVADRHAHCHGLEVGAQHVLLFRRRAFVYPVQAVLLALRNEVGAADVGRQHGFLDQLVGIVARARNDFFNAAVLVADDLRFHRFKVHRATRTPRHQQRAVHVVQVEQFGQSLLALAGLGTTGVGQNGCYLGVGHAGMAAHHGRVELVGMDFTLGGHQHVADHAQALDLGVERAQAIAQFLRQHRNDTARKIHAGGALVGVNINGAAGLHIVADIGNRHQQAPALAAPHLGWLAVHRIVKVARVFTVDGHQRHIGQVDALALVLRAHLVGQHLGQRQTGFGKLVRHAVLAHRDFNFHAGVVHLAQHLGDAAHRLAKQRGWLGQFHHHHLPRLGAGQRMGGNQHILPVALVLGRHQPDAAFLQQPANQGLLRTLGDFNNAAFRAAPAVLACNAHAHPVLVQHGAHFVGRQKDVGLLPVVTQQETMSVAVPLHGALNFVCRRRVCFCAGVHFLVVQSWSFLRCPGGGIGRRTSFRY